MTAEIIDPMDWNSAALGADLTGNHRALSHARAQHRYWSWQARWRGGGPEYRAHCQDQEKFFGGWIVRLERSRGSLLGKIAASAEISHHNLKAH